MNPERPIVGRASKQGAIAAIEAHLAVSKGKPLRAAISEALQAHPSLGGNDRRFVAFAVRELSRHLRRLDLSAKARGRAPSTLALPEDQAIFRYALWRHEFTGADVERVMVEVGLPGPVRPRSMPDAVVREALAKAVTLDFGATPLERAAAQHSFPSWLAAALAEVTPPGELDAVLAALNREPFLSLKVRPNGSRDELLATLLQAGFPV
ncbi:MAG: RsmB/NOP family class I SAM-dependent RNA methyltransferase, partial [Myxococcaceae bacterium]|nr:RsmB/NOP family class I SAM-dependent RNA methyltransferase [Myxococcaceae bacterium]